MSKDQVWENFIPFIKDGKFGFKNREDGSTVIPPAFESVDKFSHGLAAVGRSPRMGAIDHHGNIVVPLVHDEVVILGHNMFRISDDERSRLWLDGKEYEDFGGGAWDNGYGYLVADEMQGAYSVQEQKFIVPCEYDGVCLFDGVFCVLKDGKVGYLDKGGRCIAPCIYDDYPFSPDENDHIFENYIVVESDGLCGVMRRDGKLRLPCVFTGFAYPDDDVLLLEKGDESFLYNGTSDTILPFRFDGMEDFRYGVAIVRKGGRYGVIDKDFNTVIPAVYDAVDNWGFGCPLLSVCKDGFWGMVDFAGKEILPPVYDEKPGYAGEEVKIRLNGKYGVAGRDGSIIVPCRFEKVQSVAPGYLVTRDGKSGFISTDGETLTQCKYDEIRGAAYRFKMKPYLVEVESDGKWGVLDRNCREVVPCIHDMTEVNNLRIDILDGEKALCCDHDGGNIRENTFEVLDSIFTSEGTFLIVCKDGKKGLKDESGRDVIPCAFDYITGIRDTTLFTAYADGLSDLYDMKGTVAARGLEEITDFHSGLAFVKDGKGWSLMDKTGTFVRKHVCDEIIWMETYVDQNGDTVPTDLLYRDSWKFIKDGKYGFIDESGALAVPFLYDSVFVVNDGYIVRKDGLAGLLGKEGECIIPVGFDDIFAVRDTPDLWVVERNGVKGYTDRWGGFVAMTD